MDSSSVLSDDDYDVISNPSYRSLESSIADLGNAPGQAASEVHEPPPSQAALERFETAKLTADNVRIFVRKALDASHSPSGDPKGSSKKLSPAAERVVRVYVDGSFDLFNTGHALQLRQAKLSFPSVYLAVGVFSDQLLHLHGSPATLPHVERCEVVRHCRWVDEVITDAPWQVDDQLIHQHRIDYIAIDEGTSVDPTCDKTRLKGYDSMKALGKVIPTRKTTGLTPIGDPVTNPTTPITATLEAPPGLAPGFTAHIDSYEIGY